MEILKQRNPTEQILIDLSNDFDTKWDLIKSNQFLTYYLIDVIKEVRVPTNLNYIVHRKGGDSRTGGIFEDAFGQLLERYLQADVDFWSPEKEFQLKIRIICPAKKSDMWNSSIDYHDIDVPEKIPYFHPLQFLEIIRIYLQTFRKKIHRKYIIQRPKH